jgi:hypothetical protein
MDTTVWKFKENLITRTTETLKKLGFFGLCDVMAHLKYESNMTLGEN